MAVRTKRPKRRTADAVAILYRRLVEGNPEMEALLAAEEAQLEVAEQLYRLRTQAGLSQREMAEKVGTTASAISRLEDADYQGHSLAMLRRIAAALDKRVEISFVPLAKPPKHSSPALARG